MRYIQLTSVVLLIVISLIKFDVVNTDINKNVIHYIFNAVVMLTSFSILFPLYSYQKLKNLNANKIQQVSSILDEIESDHSIEVFVTEKFMKNNASVLYWKNKMVIVCGESLVNTLNTLQLKFLLAHEYYHLKNNHILKNILSFIFVLAGVPIILLISAPHLIPVLSLGVVVTIAFIVYISSFILHFFISQKREFAADKFASSLVGSEEAIKTLKLLKEQKLTPENSYNLFETHPSIKKRIEKIS